MKIKTIDLSDTNFRNIDDLFWRVIFPLVDNIKELEKQIDKLTTPVLMPVQTSVINEINNFEKDSVSVAPLIIETINPQYALQPDSVLMPAQTPVINEINNA